MLPLSMQNSSFLLPTHLWQCSLVTLFNPCMWSLTSSRLYSRGEGDGVQEGEGQPVVPRFRPLCPGRFHFCITPARDSAQEVECSGLSGPTVTLGTIGSRDVARAERGEREFLGRADLWTRGLYGFSLFSREQT